MPLEGGKIPSSTRVTNQNLNEFYGNRRVVPCALKEFQDGSRRQPIAGVVERKGTTRVFGK